jgi:hypothetical protein
MEDGLGVVDSTRVHTHTHTHTHMSTHTHVHAHNHTHTHTYAITHARSIPHRMVEKKDVSSEKQMKHSSTDSHDEPNKQAMRNKSDNGCSVWERRVCDLARARHTLSPLLSLSCLSLSLSPPHTQHTLLTWRTASGSPSSTHIPRGRQHKIPRLDHCLFFPPHTTCIGRERREKVGGITFGGMDGSGLAEHQKIRVNSAFCLFVHRKERGAGDWVHM